MPESKLPNIERRIYINRCNEFLRRILSLGKNEPNPIDDISKPIQNQVIGSLKDLVVEACSALAISGIRLSAQDIQTCTIRYFLVKMIYRNHKTQ